MLGVAAHHAFESFGLCARRGFPAGGSACPRFLAAARAGWVWIGRVHGFHDGLGTTLHARVEILRASCHAFADSRADVGTAGSAEDGAGDSTDRASSFDARFASTAAEVRAVHCVRNRRVGERECACAGSKCRRGACPCGARCGASLDARAATCVSAARRTTVRTGAATSASRRIGRARTGDGGWHCAAAQSQRRWRTAARFRKSRRRFNRSGRFGQYRCARIGYLRRNRARRDVGNHFWRRCRDGRCARRRCIAGTRRLPIEQVQLIGIRRCERRRRGIGKRARRWIDGATSGVRIRR
jgi:hypothetical protein